MKHLRAAMFVSFVLLQMVLGAATAGASTVGALRICSDCAAAGDLSRYEYVVLQSDQAGRIPALKLLGMRGIPAASEETLVARDVILAKLTERARAHRASLDRGRGRRGAPRARGRA